MSSHKSSADPSINGSAVWIIDKDCDPLREVRCVCLSSTSTGSDQPRDRAIGAFWCLAALRLASSVDLNLLLRATSAIAVLGAVLLLLVAVTGMVNVPTLLGPMILFLIGIGAASPAPITSRHQHRRPDDRSRLGTL
jgi:hypothetical protein